MAADQTLTGPDLTNGVPASQLPNGGPPIGHARGEPIHLASGALPPAIGAEPVGLNLPGSDLPHVHYLRTRAQGGAIMERATPCRGADVIGASYIGLADDTCFRCEAELGTKLAMERHDRAAVEAVVALST